jgi:hypothetical protein
MGREHESSVEEIIKKIQERLVGLEEQIRQQTKPRHWWNKPNEPDANSLGECERLRQTVLYVRSWLPRLTAVPKFPSDLQYAADTLRSAIAELKHDMDNAESETPPHNLELAYSRQRYEVTDNGGRSFGRWVYAGAGNYFHDLRSLLIGKLRDELQKLESLQRAGRNAKDH